MIRKPVVHHRANVAGFADCGAHVIDVSTPTEPKQSARWSCDPFDVTCDECLAIVFGSACSTACLAEWTPEQQAAYAGVRLEDLQPFDTHEERRGLK